MSGSRQTLRMLVGWLGIVVLVELLLLRTGTRTLIHIPGLGQLDEGGQVRVEKVAALYTSRDRAVSELAEHVREDVAESAGVEAVLREHTLVWQQLWDEHCLRLEGDEWVQLVLNLHAFHLLQTTSEQTMFRFCT